MRISTAVAIISRLDPGSDSASIGMSRPQTGMAGRLGTRPTELVARQSVALAEHVENGLQ